MRSRTNPTTPTDQAEERHICRSARGTAMSRYAPKRRLEGRGASVKSGLGRGTASDSPCCTELVVDRIAGRPRPNRRGMERRTSEMTYGRQNDRTGNREVGDRRRLGRVRDHIRVGWNRVLGGSRHHSASTRRTAETAKRRLIGTVRQAARRKELPVLGRSDRHLRRGHRGATACLNSLARPQRPQ